MAYVSNLDENGQPVTGTVGANTTPGSGVVVSTQGSPPVSSKGGTANGPEQVSQNANPSTPSTSGQFTNINAYLNANPTAANSLGDTIANTINTSTKNAGSTIDNANTAFGNEVTAGTSVYDPNLVNSAISNPTGFVKNNDNLTKLTQLQSGTYSGPTDYSQTNDAQRALAAQANSNETANLGTTAAGREELLQEQPGQATSAGGLNLNQFLVQNNPDALAKVQTATNNAGSINPQFSSGEAAAGNTVTGGQNISTATGQKVTTDLNKGLEDYRTKIANEVTAANTKANSAQQNAIDAVNGKTTYAPSSTPSGSLLGQVGTAITTALNKNTGSKSTTQPVAPAKSTAQNFAPTPDGGITRTIGGASTAAPTNNGILSTSGLPTGTRSPSGIAAQSGLIRSPTGALVGATNPATVTSASTGKSPLANLDAATLAQIGLTQAQWNNLQSLQQQASQYGGGINAGDYLTTQASKLGAAEAVDPTLAANYNALGQIAGQPDTSTLASSGTAGSQSFNVAGATTALQAQIDAGKAKAAQTAAAAQGAADAQAGVNAANRTTTAVTVVGGVIAGAEIGGTIADGVGAVVGGVIGGVVGLFSCFGAGTKVQLAGGSWINVEHIKVGDNLALGGIVFQKGSGLCNVLYQYKGVLIAGGHTVLENGVWIHVRDSNLARKLPTLNEFAIVHFLSTLHSRIQLENFVAADFQETLDEDLCMRHEQERIDLLNLLQQVENLKAVA